MRPGKLAKVGLVLASLAYFGVIYRLHANSGTGQHQTVPLRAYVPSRRAYSVAKQHGWVTSNLTKKGLVARDFQSNLSSSSNNATETGMAACLLVMDDNHFLIEWLAYHYHVLPLRHLTVAIDPRSQTSPLPVLNRWQQHYATLGLNITVWTHDRDYMTSDEQTVAEDFVRRYFGQGQKEPLSQDLIRHRARQRLFYYQCLRHHKQRGRELVLLTDSDEFLRVNYKTLAAQQRQGTRPAAPPTDQPGSILKFLRKELVRKDRHANLTLPCLQIPRVRFGAEESPIVEQHARVPMGFNATRFATLRWRKHASDDQYWLNRISKTLIDVSRVAWDDLEPVDSVHRPIRRHCGRRKLFIRASESPLHISHYLGSWEQYAYRNDSRTGRERSQSQYQKSAHLQRETDDDIRPWLEGFVKAHGVKLTHELLDGVGKVQ